MKIEIGSVFPSNIETDGTVMDFIDGEFVFVIKDQTWTPYELQALKKKTLQLDFVYKYDIAVFLLTLHDAIDTSDFIFNIHDNEYPAIFEVLDGCYKGCLYLIDANQIVQGKRVFTCSKKMSSVIMNAFQQQLAQPYHEAEFVCNLEGLQNAYEPFELQERCMFSESYS